MLEGKKGLGLEARDKLCCLQEGEEHAGAAGTKAEEGVRLGQRALVMTQGVWMTPL